MAEPLEILHRMVQLVIFLVWVFLQVVNNAVTWIGQIKHTIFEEMSIHFASYFQMFSKVQSSYTSPTWLH